MVAFERGRPMWPVAPVGVAAAVIGVTIHRNGAERARTLRPRLDARGAAEER